MTCIEADGKGLSGNLGRALLIGVGNPFRSDDAAGLVVVRRFQDPGACSVTVHEAPGDPAHLLELWTAANVVVLVDAVASGSPPGRIHRFDARRSRLPADLFSHSTHGLGVAQAVEMGRALDCLPAVLIIYGIEGADFSPGTRLSPEVLRAVDPLIGRVRLELESWRRPIEEVAGVQPSSMSKSQRGRVP